MKNKPNKQHGFGLCSVLHPRQHSIGNRVDSFKSCVEFTFSLHTVVNNF